MAKKLLRKREVRTDLNPNHFNKYGKPHNAIISAKQGHKYKANTITHSQFVNSVLTLDLDENNIHIPYKKHTRISPPFWQNENMFGEKQNTKVSRRIMRKIKHYNKKFK